MTDTRAGAEPTEDPTDGSTDDPTAAYAGFGGRVGRTFAGSESWWPPRPTPPEGAPNIVVIMVDDLGFSDLGCYGSELTTPNLDRLAAGGLRYTDFHVAPMCSPTRAALLTGCNPHDAGIGSVVHSDAGFPGYAMQLTEHAATLPELLRDHGYATFMVGKWHLTKDAEQNAAGDKSSWPCQRGFDRYYGVLDAFTNLHQPHRIVEDNHQVAVDDYPEGYYFTDDITDRAIDMIREVKAADPAKPFFCYVAHGAVHAPLHAKADDIAAHQGRFDEGWDVLRQRRYERQLELGIVEDGTRLAPRNPEPGHDVPAWDDVPDEHQPLYARYMEVYGAMVEAIDRSVGRLVGALDELGELENTIVIFTSDNGASREGEEVGTSAYYVHLLQGDDVEADLARIDLIGGPQTTPHYPRGWAMLGNTPFRLYKINTHRGGHSVPFVVHWPAGIGDGLRGGLRRQYAHITDLLPTLLDIVGVERPDERNGKPLKPINGVSFRPTITDPDAPSRHTEQLYEQNGHRGYYRDGWEVVALHDGLTPFGDHEWELFDLRSDPTELDDRRDDEPERLAELAAAWEEAAWAGQVYPLDEGSSIRYLIRPDWVEAFGAPVTLRPGLDTLERWRSVQLIWFRAVEIAVSLTYLAGDQGTLFAHGDQGSGYGLYVREGRLVYLHNDGRGHVRELDGGELADGASSIVVRKEAPGGNVWTVHLSVDGDEVGVLEGVPMLYGMAPFQGIDVGIDRRSPVSWEQYERFGPFPFTGDLHSVTYTPGDPAPDAPQNLMAMLREMGAKFE
ncbi:MAG: arylsulfatase [Acidimicrobiales bacterium]